MKNMDLAKQQKEEIVTKINQAMKDGNEEAFAEAFIAYTELLQEAVIAEAKGLVQDADNQILSGRGARPLTSEETKYYQTIINAMKSSNPKQALADFNVILPVTVIDAVFEDLKEEHPLLDVINFMQTDALVEIIVNTQDGRHLATWDDLCTEIVKELTGGFKKLSLAQKKLSAFIPVCKAMLDLGPVWLDRYVRAILSEAIANGLEKGIIDGNGLKAPCGMRRDPNSPLDPVTGYLLTPLVPLNVITPESYGALIADLLISPNGLNRVITEVLLVVNPIDYYKKIGPATTVRKPDGTYANNIFPFPTKLVTSAYVPLDEAILGIGKRYFMGLGTGAGGKIEYSDENRFLEDERVYLTKLYGNGMPLDSNSFRRLDITNLKTHVTPVYVTNDPLNVAGNVGVTGDVGITGQPIEIAGINDARLSSLKIGALTLSPAFNKSVFVYTAATTDATNTITAIAKDGDATITIKVNNAAHTNGTAATWEAGENTVVITVLNDTEDETYTVTVTKS